MKKKKKRRAFSKEATIIINAKRKRAKLSRKKNALATLSIVRTALFCVLSTTFLVKDPHWLFDRTTPIAILYVNWLKIPQKH
jgi:hypothetical protein